MDNKKKHREGFARVIDKDAPSKKELVTVSYKIPKSFHREIGMFCAARSIKKIDLFVVAMSEYMKNNHDVRLLI